MSLPEESDHRPPVPILPTVQPKQELAINALLMGATDREAAERAGVRRETVHRWKHADPYFIAELARRRTEAWDAQREALRGLLAKAVGVLDNAMSDQSSTVRLRAASTVLRALGIGAEAFPAPGGLTDPAAVMKRWRRNAELERQSSEMEALVERALSGRL